MLYCAGTPFWTDSRLWNTKLASKPMLLHKHVSFCPLRPCSSLGMFQTGSAGPCLGKIGPCRRTLVTVFPYKSQGKLGPCRDLVGTLSGKTKGKGDLVGTLSGLCRDLVTVSCCKSQESWDLVEDLVGTLLGPCHAILLGPVETLSLHRRKSCFFGTSLNGP